MATVIRFLPYNEAWRTPPIYTEKLPKHAWCGRKPAAFSQNCYGDVLICFASLCIALVCIALHCIGLYCLHWFVLLDVVSLCFADFGVSICLLLCIALHCFGLHCFALLCFALYCLHCFVLLDVASLCFADSSLLICFLLCIALQNQMRTRFPKCFVLFVVDVLLFAFVFQ